MIRCRSDRSSRGRAFFALKLAAGVFAALALLLSCGAVATVFIARAIEARYPPAGRFVEVAGGRLHVVEMTPADRAPEATVLLLHGASGSSADLVSTLGERLSRRLRVLAVDRPGSGWSDRIGGSDAASPARQGAIIADALRRLGVTRAIVVGHSWAGALATNLALDHADLVSGLVLLAPATHPWPRGELSWYVAPGAWPGVGWLLTRTIGVPAALLWIDSMMATIFDPQAPPPDYQERARVALAFRPEVLSANAEDLAGLYGFVAAQSRRYGAIRTPTVIVSGDADKVVWTNLHSRFLARDIPGARLVLLPGVGHMPHHFAPDRIAGEIETMAAGAKGSGSVDSASLPAGAAPWSRPEPGPAATIELPALLRLSATKESLRGPDRSTGDAVVLPITVALLTSAAARAGDGAAVRQLAHELLALRSEPGPGWGIGFPSDAFGDGSVNPANTIYGLVTAFAAGALVDAFEASGEPRYRDVAIEALDHYAAFAVRDRDGVFMAHSDQPSDRIAVYANSALLMGEYARAGAVTGREDFAALADALFRSLRAARLDTPLGPAWPYSFTNPSWNDTLHAAYLGFGIARYAKHRPQAEAELPLLAGYLRRFVRDEAVAEHAPHADLKPKFHSRPASVWGAGMLASALAELGDCDTARAVARRLDRYRRPDGKFAFGPDDRTYYPAAHAHAVFGLAAQHRGCP